MSTTKKKHRDYKNDYPSVTEILGVLRKIGLEFWFKNNSAQFCNEESSKGKLIGTQIHDCIESFIATGSATLDTEYDVEVSNALNSFMAFRKDRPEIPLRKAEMLLTSRKYFFNGQIDCISDAMIVDWKSGNCKDKVQPTIYDEWKYQVAAYTCLYNEIHGTNINKAIIVAIAKDKVAYTTYEMDGAEIEDCFNKVFLPCLSILNYQKEQKQIAKERKQK